MVDDDTARHGRSRLRSAVRSGTSCNPGRAQPLVTNAPPRERNARSPLLTINVGANEAFCHARLVLLEARHRRTISLAEQSLRNRQRRGAFHDEEASITVW